MHNKPLTSLKRPQLFQVATTALGRAFCSHSRRQRDITRQSPPCAKPNDFPAHSCLEDLLPWPPPPPSGAYCLSGHARHSPPIRLPATSSNGRQAFQPVTPCTLVGRGVLFCVRWTLTGLDGPGPLGRGPVAPVRGSASSWGRTLEPSPLGRAVVPGSLGLAFRGCWTQPPQSACPTPPPTPRLAPWCVPHGVGV